jgi:formylglycine-generating enzyme required for sulfatase activity
VSFQFSVFSYKDLGNMPCSQALKALWRTLIALTLMVMVWAASAFSQETAEAQGIRFRLIPAGYYLLGSPISEPGRYADEDTPHRVRVDSFYLAVTETTNAQYARFLQATGQQAPLYWEDKNLNGPNHPVVGVTWDDALAFCQWLTQMTGVTHSLPTEAQWEAAARGGLTGQPYPWGDEPPDAGGVYRANVSEWCLDQYQPAASGPFQPGPMRLLKGGSWFSQARDLRCAARQSAPPGYADGYIGFRVVRQANSAQ